MSLMSLQGAINLATRQNAKPGPLTFVGVADSCEVAFETETVTQVESHTGNRLEVGSLTMSKSGTLSMVLKDWNLHNLALVMYGKELKTTAGSVTAEAVPAGVVAGARIRVDHPFISDVAIDNNGTPLVEGTDYVVESTNAGIIQFLTAPSAGTTIAYQYVDSNSLSIFTEPSPERWFLLDGMNTADENAPLVLQLYRVKFNPIENLSLLHNEGFGELPVSGSVLADLEQPVNSEMGYFGHISQKAV